MIALEPIVMDGRLKTTVRQLREGTFHKLWSQIPVEAWVTQPGVTHDMASVVCAEDYGACGGEMTSSSCGTGTCWFCYIEGYRGYRG